MGEQHIIRRAEAARAGLSDAGLRRLSTSHQLVRIRRGAYLDAQVTAQLDTIQHHALNVRAALADQRGNAVVSHVSAAVLWGLPIWKVDLDPVHLSKTRRSAGRRTVNLHVHTAPLDAGDIVEIDGIHVTSAARTVFDLASRLPFEQAVVLADAALHAGLVTDDQLRHELAIGTGRWGRSQAALVIGFADGRSESVGESRSRVGMHRAGLPAPGLQCTLRRPNGSVAGRPDFDWAPVPLLGEFDGLQKYGRLLRPGETPADAVVREKRREDALRELGYLLIRWVWADLEQPGLLYPRIMAALERAAQFAR